MIENNCCLCQEYIQSASDALYAATAPVSGRYFGEVTILQPQHWPEDNTTSATTESAQKATFLVESDSPAWGSNPHTIRLQGACGSLGKVIVLPESFTKDKNEALKYGSNIGIKDNKKLNVNSFHVVLSELLYKIKTTIITITVILDTGKI